MVIFNERLWMFARLPADAITLDTETCRLQDMIAETHFNSGAIDTRYYHCNPSITPQRLLVENSTSVNESSFLCDSQDASQRYAGERLQAGDRQGGC